MTQAELAERAELDLSTVSTFFNHHHWPRARSRAKYERALDWPYGTLADIAAGGDPPGRPSSMAVDPVEATIEQIPHLLDDDRELFLRVYRTRRDEHTLRRLADLEAMREQAESNYDGDEHGRRAVLDNLEKRIATLKRAGYDTDRSDMKS